MLHCPRRSKFFTPFHCVIISLFYVDCLQLNEILEGILLVALESRSKLAPERAFEHCLILEQCKVQVDLAHRVILIADDFVESLAKLK